MDALFFFSTVLGSVSAMFVFNKYLSGRERVAVASFSATCWVIFFLVTEH